jgi:hypothetical protein
VALEATAYAGELGLTATIPLIDVPTSRTGLTRVAGIYKDDGYTSLWRFVGQKRTQLSKTPVVVLGPLAFADRHPAAHVRQVFQHKRRLRVFRPLDQRFCDTMVDPALKLRLASCHGFEPTFRPFGPRALKGLAVGHGSLAHDFNIVTRVPVAVRVGGQIDNTQVHPKKAFRNDGRCFWGVERHEQIEDALDQHQIGLALGPVELDTLVLSHLHRDQFASVQRRQTDFLKPMKRHNPFVIDDSAVWTKRDLLRLVALVRFHRFGKSANRQLCRQTKALTHVVVQGFLQLKLRGTALLEGVLRNPRTRHIEGMHRLQQGGVLS